VCLFVHRNRKCDSFSPLDRIGPLGDSLRDDTKRSSSIFDLSQLPQIPLNWRFSVKRLNREGADSLQRGRILACLFVCPSARERELWQFIQGGPIKPHIFEIPYFLQPLQI